VTGSNPRILLVRLSAFGDCLHAIPTLVALRRHFPGAYIGWAIEELSYSLLKDHPMVDQFHLFPRHAFKKAKTPAAEPARNTGFMDRLRDMQKFRKELSAAHYDFAIDLQGLTKSGLVSWWSNAKKRIGFKGEDSREFNIIFNNERVVPPDEAVHVVEKNLSLVRAVGAQVPDKPEWVMPAFDKELDALRPFLQKCGLISQSGAIHDYAIVNPGATWFTKRWPPESFGEVARGLIQRHNLRVIVPWAGGEEKKAAHTIVAAAGEGAFLAPDTDLRHLAALTRPAILFVGNDTGPLHLAVALNVPSVAIFGATDPFRNGPYGTMNRIQTGGVDCHPCWKTTCERQDRACLVWVKPETVLNSCTSILRKRRDTTGSSSAMIKIA